MADEKKKRRKKRQKKRRKKPAAKKAAPKKAAKKAREKTAAKKAAAKKARKAKEKAPAKKEAAKKPAAKKAEPKKAKKPVAIVGPGQLPLRAGRAPQGAAGRRPGARPAHRQGPGAAPVLAPRRRAGHRKLIESAASNAENNHDLVADEMRVAEITVDEGPDPEAVPAAGARAGRPRSTSEPATSPWR